MEDMISTENVARFLGITRPTVIKYIQGGRLKAARTGKAYKISRSDLVDFAKNIGINGSRLAELDHFLLKRNKKTRTLDNPLPGSRLVLNPTPVSFSPEPDAFYFVAVRVHPDAREILFRVNTTKYFVGRHSLASLSIQDPYVSTLHTTLIFDENLVKVLDQSTNGTNIKLRTLRSGDSQVLGDGDQFQVGEVVFTLVSPERVDQYLGFGI